MQSGFPRRRKRELTHNRPAVHRGLRAAPRRFSAPRRVAFVAPARRQPHAIVPHSKHSADGVPVAAISTRPPDSRGPTPWRMAFSANGCSKRLGTIPAADCRGPEPTREVGLRNGPFDVEKAVQERHSSPRVTGGCARAAATPERVAELRHEPRAIRGIRSVNNDDGIERVEQEVGLQLRPQALQLGLDEPALQVRGPHRQLVRLPGAALRLVRVVTREREADDDGVDREVRIQPVEKELSEVGWEMRRARSARSGEGRSPRRSPPRRAARGGPIGPAASSPRPAANRSRKSRA